MLARLYASTPIGLAVPKGVQFQIAEYSFGEYKVRFYPPLRITDFPERGADIKSISVDGMEAIISNAIQIDFQKEEFDRSAEVQCDPPFEVLSSAYASYLERLRFVTKSHALHIPPWIEVRWHLKYLQDDGTEMRAEEGMGTGRGGVSRQMAVTAVDSSVWKDLHDLAYDFEPPIWIRLMLDAHAALPDVGVSLVLARSALEICIGSLLDRLAKESDVPDALWEWINDQKRGWWRVPSTKDRMGTLCEILLGESLKNQSVLWEAFCNLSDARNSFIHDGTPRIGNKIVDEGMAMSLVAKAREALEYMNTILPEHLKWPEIRSSAKISFRFNAIP